MNQEIKVVGIGDLCLDFTAATDKIPATDMAAALLHTTSQGGGKVPTALVALSRLGVPCALMCTVGDDAAGRFCKQELQDCGVCTDYMTVLDEKTNLTICLAEQSTGGRSFIGKYDMPTVKPEQLDRRLIENAQYLHLWSASDAAKSAARWIHAAGGRTVYDADRYNAATEQMLPMIDVFICSEFFFEGMFGAERSDEALEKGLRELCGRGCEIAVVTLGAKGCAGVSKDGFFRLPAFTGIHVADSTGAGDTFHGAFIYGLLQGWSAEKTARFSSAVSAIKCTVPGGRAGIPDLETVMHFLETGEINTALSEKWQAYYAAHSLI